MTKTDPAVTVTKPAPSTAAERKRAQRRRDRQLIFACSLSIESAGTAALIEALPTLMRANAPNYLARALCEIGRRGGVTVTARPAGTTSSSSTVT